MKINYIIATYASVGKRKYTYPKVEKTLYSHIEKILNLENNISQITIMKAECLIEEKMKEYYNIDILIKKSKIPIIFKDVENYGYSEGQWLKSYEMDKSFDYYLFIEDDYCPNFDNFDKILLECYKYKFPENIGLLSSCVQGNKNFKQIGGHPEHFEGCVFISNLSLEKLYSFTKWDKMPRKWLDLLEVSYGESFSKNYKKNNLGGYYQLTFSHLFTLSGIKLDDYLDIFYEPNKKFEFPYWHDSGNTVWFYEKGDKVKEDYTIEDIINSLIIPIQLSKVEYIIQNTNLNVLKEKYPHRICLDIVENFKNILKGKTICDLGCGSGDM